MKRFLLCLAAAAGLFSLSAQTVYDFQVKDAEGRNVALSRYKDKVTEKIRVIEADIKNCLQQPGSSKKNKR